MDYCGKPLASGMDHPTVETCVQDLFLEEMDTKDKNNHLDCYQQVQKQAL